MIWTTQLNKMGVRRRVTAPFRKSWFCVCETSVSLLHFGKLTFTLHVATACVWCSCVWDAVSGKGPRKREVK